MKTIRSISILTVCVCFLNACVSLMPSSTPPENEKMSVEEREKETRQVASWELSGAMAAKNNQKAWTASLNWLQRSPDNYQLRLSGPLGSGSVLIENRGGLLTYKDGPKTIQSRDAEQLLAQQTGIRLPVNVLYYWVRGLPAPGAVQSKKYDEYNHLTQLKQAGYTIDYTRYTAVKGKDLPSKIRLTGHGILIKLVIKHWRI